VESRDTIFLNARELPDAAERSAYVAQACGVDSTLRAKVEAMLNDVADAANFFEQTERLAGTHPVSEAPGAIIGRYKLLQKIGEGGMGVVYMAEQREPVIRKVALKIIKLGMDTRQVVARFEAERQALALMDHPNIAKVLDAGATETGRPYFVMDLVQGLPITQFCDDAQLSTRERLDLFLEVCSAIEHAHQKGIIHRDIKPSNILVTVHGHKPVPKIIDFGIAKALQQRLTEKTLFTQFQQFVGTPAYTSPEQASLSGLDIDTRSDIYGLGVLLYELLTGTTPFHENELLRAGLDEMRRTIQEREPSRPSARLSTLQGEDLAKAARHRASEPPKLICLVRGDLDWIVMKCLEKDRARRYDNANGLAADLKRYLGNEPIVARPPSAGYRLQKWIRRNKVQFAALSIIAVILVAATAVSTWQAMRATHAQRAFQEQAETAQTVKNFLLKQLLGSGDAWAGRSFDTNNRMIVERISDEIEGGIFTNQPVVEAEVRHALGDALSTMDNFPRALHQYEKAFALRQKVLGDAHSETLLSASQIGYMLYSLGRHTEADRLLDDAIGKARAASMIKTHGAAEALFTRGWRLSFDGQSEKAMPYITEALSGFRAALGENDSRVFSGRFMLAVCTQGTGQIPDADRLFEEALRDCERVHGPRHYMVPVFLKGHALLRLQQNRVQEAISELERAVSLMQDGSGRNNEYTLEAETFLADAVAKNGDTNTAISRYVDLSRRWAQHLPGDLARRKLRNIADALVRHRQYEEARVIFMDLKKALNQVPPERADEFEILLRATLAVDDWVAGADLCVRYMDRFADSAWTWLQKAWVSRAAGRADAYRDCVQKMLSSLPRVLNTNEQHIPIEIAGLGLADLSSVQRLELVGSARNLEAALPDRPHSLQQWGYRAIAQFHLRLGDQNACLENLQRSKAAQSEPDAYACFLKAVCLKRMGRSGDALAALREGDAIVLSKALPEAAERFLSVADFYQLRLTQREAHSELGEP
jgi:serine/threonine protein kinase